MDRDRINKMIDDDRELESIMATAMRQVGREHDDRLVAEMSAMDEEAMRREIAKSKVLIHRQPLLKRMVSSVYFRAAAACIVCVLLIWGAAFLPFTETKSSGYATMFNQYYTEYNATPFDAQGDRLNTNGKKSTAQLIEDASQLLSQRSRQSTRRAIEILEWLLDNQWRKTSLDPEIHWYLGLAYLKDGQKADAQTQFEIVKASGKSHAAEAASLLSDLASKKK